MQLFFNSNGLSFKVDVEVLEDENCVDTINSVEVLAENGDYIVADVDKEEFFEGMEDLLNELAEEAIRDRAIAYAEMRLDSKREEGE